MKITICGSMYFAKRMQDLRDELKKLGHEVEIPQFTDEAQENPELNMDFELLQEHDCMMGHFKKVAWSDAILIINEEKNGIGGYVGANTLMEMGVALYLGKKIFILNQYPSEDILRHSFEIKMTNPIVINGDLKKIK